MVDRLDLNLVVTLVVMGLVSWLVDWVDVDDVMGRAVGLGLRLWRPTWGAV